MSTRDQDGRTIKKPTTTKAKLVLATAMLLRVQKAHFHEPDSDAMEYCNGCGRSPYNVPPHKDDCLVVALGETLKTLGTKNER